MELNPEQFKKFLPLPVTLITTVSAQGTVNGAPYSCVMPILRPLDLIAIASALPRDTLRNIRETKEMVVNVFGKPSFRDMMKCAQDHPPEVNELEEAGLETLPSKKVAPPRVKDAIGWIEARLEKEILADDYSLIIGRVLCSEINDQCLEGDKLSEEPIVLLFPFFRALGPNVARRDEFDIFHPAPPANEDKQ
jgi:flavin reductase (DIM6/NTAB) family NADH-FMN oxidoreductase RutF